MSLPHRSLPTPSPALAGDTAPDALSPVAPGSGDEAPVAWLHGLHDGACVLRGSVLQYANPALAQLLGYDADELTGLDIEQLVQPDDCRKLRALSWRKIAHSEALHDIEVSLLHRQGEALPVRMSGSAVLWKGRRAVLAMIVDMSYRKELEQALLESQRHLMQLIAAAPFPLIACRQHDDQVLFANPSAEQMFGVPAASLQAPAHYALDDGALQLRQALLGEGSHKQVQLHLQRPDGETLWAMASCQRTQFGSEPVHLYSLFDNTLHKLAEQRLGHLAHTDALTGLPNRILYFDRLEQAIAQASRANSMVGVLFIDLNGFKAINDELGHATGDAVLHEIATRLDSCVRSSDTLARLGGDEFAAVLTQLKHDHEAAQVAQKMVLAVQQPLGTGGAQGHRLGVSIGIALFPLHGNDAVSLLRLADQAMYRAKQDPERSVVSIQPLPLESAAPQGTSRHDR